MSQVERQDTFWSIHMYQNISGGTSTISQIECQEKFYFYTKKGSDIFFPSIFSTSNRRAKEGREMQVVRTSTCLQVSNSKLSLKLSKACR